MKTMKSLSEIDGYLNESLKAGKINTPKGFGFAEIKRTEDGMGFTVDVTFQGSVMEGDLPADAEEKLKNFMAEVEKMMLTDLDWLQ